MRRTARGISTEGMRNSWRARGKSSSSGRFARDDQLGLQGLLDADKFARGPAHHLVDVLDDHAAVARIEEMVRLQCLQNDFLKNVKLEDQFFQRVRGLVRALLAMNGQIRQVPRCGSGVRPVGKNFRHHFKHLRKAVAKNNLRSPCRW